MEEAVSKYPNDLEDAIGILKVFYKKALLECMDMTERQFSARSHHMAGTFIRNEWHLWWHENNKIPSWPTEKPIIVKWFNDLGITHADDMSGIILTSLFRSLKGEDIKLDDQIEYYKNHWRGQGYKDGIFKPER